VPFDGGATLGWPGSRYAPRQVRQALEWMWMRVHDGRIYDVDGERFIEVPETCSSTAATSPSCRTT
jgi:formiminoglutamase/agmatinase